MSKLRLEGNQSKLIDAILAKFEIVTASSIVNSSGELQGGMIRPGYEERFKSHGNVSKTMWGTWFSILLSVAGKMDEYGQKVSTSLLGGPSTKRS